MNQILATKLKNDKKKFIMIFVFSSVCIILILTYIIYQLLKRDGEEELTNLYSQTLNIEKIYSTKRLTNEKSVILGRIIIPKINLDYVIFNNFNEDLLKVSICKFYGGALRENGNIGLAGHNYDDERFFSKINTLEIGDEIIIEDIEKNEFIYKVMNIYETDSKDTSCLQKSENINQEITLVTCNNKNGKRIIVKAGIKK